MSVVVFRYTDFIAQFPELASVSQSLLAAYFASAGDFVNNTDCSPIPDLPAQGGLRTRVLYLTTAHIAKMFATINGQAPSGLVGHINNASEGSVSVGTDLNLTSQSAQWWAQTPYGFMAWQALAPYRQFLYVGRPQRTFNPYFYAGGTPYVTPPYGGVK